MLYNASRRGDMRNEKTRYNQKVARGVGASVVEYYTRRNRDKCRSGMRNSIQNRAKRDVVNRGNSRNFRGDFCAEANHHDMRGSRRNTDWIIPNWN